MANPSDPVRFKTVEYTVHPLTTPLVEYHGLIVKTFSPLPSEGKLLEMVKRILLVVIAPFAYLVLALIAGIGYPITSIKTKQVVDDSIPRGFDSEAINSILLKTMESLKTSLVKYGVSQFKSAIMNIKINDIEQNYSLKERDEKVYTFESLRLESASEHVIRALSEKAAETGPIENIFINWELILTTTEGEHYFDFNIMKKPGLCSTSLEPGYGFKSFKVPDIDPELMRLGLLG